MSFVEIKGIKKHYGQGDSYVDALNDINMNIDKGQIVVLLGPSGSGYCPFFRLAATRRLWAMLVLTVKGVIM